MRPPGFDRRGKICYPYGIEKGDSTMKALPLASILALGMATAPALAQTQPPTVDELVTFFSETIELGATKGLCIGTEQECAQQQKPEGRDMLVTFELGSAELTQQARESLSVYVQAMNDDRLQTVNFAVEGHTDGLGAEAFNSELSRARAASVKAFLVEQGVSPERLTAIGLGESQPRTDNVYDPQNRRVELRVNMQ